MKNLKILFSALAVVLAVSGVFASKFSATAPGYLRILDKDGKVMFCEYVTECDNAGDYDCTIIGYPSAIQLYGMESDCGAVLKHSTPYVQ